jgi:hypothetical protein
LDKELIAEALGWAWTNLQGRMPDANTMTKTEIENYWVSYENILRAAILNVTGKEPV